MLASFRVLASRAGHKSRDSVAAAGQHLFEQLGGNLLARPCNSASSQLQAIRAFKSLPSATQQVLARVAKTASKSRIQQQHDRDTAAARKKFGANLLALRFTFPPMQIRPLGNTSFVRGVTLGKEVNLELVKREYRDSVLHSSRDFCILSSSTYIKQGKPSGTQAPASDTKSVPDDLLLSTTSKQGGGLLRQKRWAEVSQENFYKPMPLTGCIVVFTFGGLVQFSQSSSADHVTEWAVRLRPMTLDPISSKHSEGGALSIEPGLPNRSGIRFDAEGMSLKQWNLGNLETVSRVIAQSVALDYYHHVVDEQAKAVDKLVERIRDRHALSAPHAVCLEIVEIARDMLTATVRALQTLWSTQLASESEELLKARRINSRMLVSLCSDLKLFHSKMTKSLGMLDKSYTPWESERHELLWQALHRYYDIVKRSDQLMTKLKLVSDSADFLRGYKATKTSHRWEATITALITVELLLSLYHHRLMAQLTIGG